MDRDEKWLLEEKHGGEKTAGFFSDLERLRADEPLAYIIGYVPFLGCRINLDSKPLIPRAETEYWVEKAIKEIQQVPTPAVLDLCAGSGCIGVAAAHAVPTVRVDFVEIDETHHSTIQKNLAANNLSSEDVKIFGGNLFENVTGTYDFILSNPPYIDPIVDRAEPSVKAHEPQLSLYGGEQGLEIIRAIIQDSKKYLKEKGQLWIEHEPEQVMEIQKCAEAAGFRATMHTDQYGVERYSVLTPV
jgi:release factor-specific protein-(glutamine-N5) methyltransferase